MGDRNLIDNLCGCLPHSPTLNGVKPTFSTLADWEDEDDVEYFPTFSGRSEEFSLNLVQDVGFEGEINEPQLEVSEK
jgi:hypothetical protein